MCDTVQPSGSSAMVLLEMMEFIIRSYHRIESCLSSRSSVVRTRARGSAGYGGISWSTQGCMIRSTCVRKYYQRQDYKP